MIRYRSICDGSGSTFTTRPTPQPTLVQRTLFKPHFFVTSQYRPVFKPFRVYLARLREGDGGWHWPNTCCAPTRSRRATRDLRRISHGRCSWRPSTTRSPLRILEKRQQNNEHLKRAVSVLFRLSTTNLNALGGAISLVCSGLEGGDGYSESVFLMLVL